MVRTSPLASDLAAARAQGWQIEPVDKHTIRLTHPQVGELIVDDRKGGEHTRMALRQAMQKFRERLAAIYEDDEIPW